MSAPATIARSVTARSVLRARARSGQSGDVWTAAAVRRVCEPAVAPRVWSGGVLGVVAHGVDPTIPRFEDEPGVAPFVPLDEAQFEALTARFDLDGRTRSSLRGRGRVRYVVEFASGEVGKVEAAPQAMFGLLQGGDVTGVRADFGPRWLPHLDAIHPTLRKAEARPAFDAALASLLPMPLVGDANGLAGLEVFHGTLRGFEASLRAGPRNVGGGLGGRGLYLALRGTAEAGEWASAAARKAEARIGNAGGAPFAESADARGPIVLSGRIDPAQAAQLKVGRFTARLASDATMADLRRGLLPGCYADDPRIMRALLNNYDVLDVELDWPMVGNTGRMLVAHESAGGAIKWNDGVFVPEVVG